MENTVFNNVETIIKTFNDKVTNLFEGERKKLMDNFETQVKNDFFSKMNNLYEKNGFKDASITFDQIAVKINQKYNSINRQYIINLTTKWKKDFRPDEFIVNYKCQLQSGCWSTLYFFVLILTNYGSLFIHVQNIKDYKYENKLGKFILDDGILTIVNGFIDFFLFEKEKYKNTHNKSNFVTNVFSRNIDSSSHSTEKEGKTIALLDDISKISSIIQEYQDNHFNKPTIDHKLNITYENILTEKEKTKGNNMAEQEKIRIAQEKLDNDMAKYKKIKDIEKMWLELKESQNKLKILSDNLELQKKKLEEEKKMLENQKNLMDIDKVVVGNNFDDFIKNKDEKKDKCGICFGDIEKKISLVPCGHTGFHRNCLDNMKEKKCPVCRADYDLCINIYLKH